MSKYTTGWWANESLAASAGSSCAQLAWAPGLNNQSGLGGGPGWRGAWCFCKPTAEEEAAVGAGGGMARFDGAAALTPFPRFAHCDNPEGIPVQINVQIAAPDTIVLSFVTFEAVPPAGNLFLLTSAVSA
jgi:hypothetical protein